MFPTAWTIYFNQNWPCHGFTLNKMRSPPHVWLLMCSVAPLCCWTHLNVTQVAVYARNRSQEQREQLHFLSVHLWTTDTDQSVRRLYVTTTWEQHILQSQYHLYFVFFLRMVQSVKLQWEEGGQSGGVSQVHVCKSCLDHMDTKVNISDLQTL